jgi:hypothetical protein
MPTTHTARHWEPRTGSIILSHNWIFTIAPTIHHLYLEFVRLYISSQYINKANSNFSYPFQKGYSITLCQPVQGILRHSIHRRTVSLMFLRKKIFFGQISGRRHFLFCFRAEFARPADAYWKSICFTRAPFTGWSKPVLRLTSADFITFFRNHNLLRSEITIERSIGS